MATSFHVTAADGVALLTLSRPAASNALTLEFWREFPLAVRALDASGTVRALVIAAEGKNFCAGMDLSVFSSAGTLESQDAASRTSFYQAARQMQAALAALEEARFPVIAAIQGACVGAGLELAACCDLRFAAEGAYFKIAEIDIGMMADLGALQRLPKLLPDAVVKQMAYTGMTLPAARAEALGFVNGVGTDVLALAKTAAAEVSARAPLAIAGSKEALLYARDHSVAEALERTAWVQSAIWDTADIKAAMTGRMTKSVPVFKDLPARRGL